MGWAIVIQGLLVLSVLVFLPTTRTSGAIRQWLRAFQASKRQPDPPQLAATKVDDKEPSSSPPLSEQRSRENSTTLSFYKDYYYKLQNLENHPEILAPARDLLIDLFAETIDNAQNSEIPGILSVKNYTPEKLSAFIQTEHDNITKEWQDYVSRRASGAPTELFGSKQECLWWLRQVAPVKYVDGAWLGHVNKVTTPFFLRKATKDAWQIMSEELGDGEPVMNHVYVYRELMHQLAAGLPDGDSIEFIHPRHELDEVCSWKAAVAQLLISLFPHEFLPEILGFNMHFEALTMETMKAAKEVEEFGFNAYYFILHISIDNADSGHTAIAMQTVCKYIELIRQAEGDAAAQLAWKRVQAGFILSSHLSSAPQSASGQRKAATKFPRNEREAGVIDIFVSKAPVAHRIHCTNRVRLGGRRLVDWLEPQALSNKQWQMEFMDTLSNFRPWICRGDSNNSKLIQELSWEGKMFGSFTKSEVEAVRRWIDGLSGPDPQIYWSFTEWSRTRSDQLLTNQDIRSDYPVFFENPTSKLPTPTIPHNAIFPPLPFLPPSPASAKSLPTPDMSKLIPLWFTHQCLLESFVNVPAKTTTMTASSIVRILRAQYGFEAEGFSVAGTDESQRDDAVGLVELGLEMLQKLGLGRPSSLKEVLAEHPSPFAEQMLHLSMRPMENFALLLGLSWAFVGLHDYMASSALLPSGRHALLREIVRRERECLEMICSTEFKDDSARVEDFYRGYALGRKELGVCFGVELLCGEEEVQKTTGYGIANEVTVSA